MPTPIKALFLGGGGIGGGPLDSHEISTKENFPSVMTQGKTVKLQESEIHTYLTCHRNPRFLPFLGFISPIF